MRTSALLVQKPRIFRNLWCVRTDKENEPVRTMGVGSGFRDFAQKSFMDYFSRVNQTPDNDGCS